MTPQQFTFAVVKVNVNRVLWIGCRLNSEELLTEHGINNIFLSSLLKTRRVKIYKFNLSYNTMFDIRCLQVEANHKELITSA